MWSLFPNLKFVKIKLQLNSSVGDNLLEGDESLKILYWR